MPHFPMTLSPTEQDATADEFVDLIFGACGTCGSEQLMSLVDPTILYAHAHNTTSHSRTWCDHHAALAEFILSAELSTERKVVEIGGASGDLARLLTTVLKNYLIMDMSPSIHADQKFKVVQGNCETSDFEPGCALVLSHVFEHLYNPATFALNCAKQRVSDVFISIPNMTACETVPIHVEHTFFVDTSDTTRVFAAAGYALHATLEFRSHSCFYHFRTAATPPQGRDAHVTGGVILAPGRSRNIVRMLEQRKCYFEDLRISDNSFVAPGGPYGQVLYYYTRCNIQGFLDNDQYKQRKRVYGTPHTTLPISALQTAGAVDVYLYGGPYTSELQERVLRTNSKVRLNIL
jgi:hypothetical protein